MNNQMQPQWRGIIYQLKRNYGAPIQVFTRNTATFDRATGDRSFEATRWCIQRAVVMTAKVALTVQEGIYVNKLNPRLAKGGGYDTNTRVFMVDRRDYPTLVIQREDWIEYNNIKYEIETIEDFPIDTCYLITAQGLIGEPLTVLTPHVTSTITLAPNTVASHT